MLIQLFLNSAILKKHKGIVRPRNKASRHRAEFAQVSSLLDRLSSTELGKQ